ncbi:hypothetical protein CAOG_00683 [Capsaspora owczarzaki ATCC 30864]|uniref:hypothetical protein n=1 Tax=Capsaspora owczarzaki (strain ATCC 30864) TaxID=595528 RepID=UPI0001FE4E5A|nr:hypothetical protein CAOG_00683 [Capsaspora owczarzaki ATCC 30864]|eukprot:XP_004365554.1 hypothetical protein CAOG_00683 [Capsaspora owczarzaki ATCC 30864]
MLSRAGASVVPRSSAAISAAATTACNNSSFAPSRCSPRVVGAIAGAERLLAAKGRAMSLLAAMPERGLRAITAATARTTMPAMFHQPGASVLQGCRLLDGSEQLQWPSTQRRCQSTAAPPAPAATAATGSDSTNGAADHATGQDASASTQAIDSRTGRRWDSTERLPAQVHTSVPANRNPLFALPNTATAKELADMSTGDFSNAIVVWTSAFYQRKDATFGRAPHLASLRPVYGRIKNQLRLLQDELERRATLPTASLDADGASDSLRQASALQGLRERIVSAVDGIRFYEGAVFYQLGFVSAATTLWSETLVSAAGRTASSPLTIDPRLIISLLFSLRFRSGFINAFASEIAALLHSPAAQASLRQWFIDGSGQGNSFVCAVHAFAYFSGILQRPGMTPASAGYNALVPALRDHYPPAQVLYAMYATRIHPEFDLNRVRDLSQTQLREASNDGFDYAIARTSFTQLLAQAERSGAAKRLMDAIEHDHPECLLRAGYLGVIGTLPFPGEGRGDRDASSSSVEQLQRSKSRALAMLIRGAALGSGPSAHLAAKFQLLGCVRPVAMSQIRQLLLISMRMNDPLNAVEAVNLLGKSFLNHQSANLTASILTDTQKLALLCFRLAVNVATSAIETTTAQLQAVRAHNIHGGSLATSVAATEAISAGFLDEGGADSFADITASASGSTPIATPTAQLQHSLNELFVQRATAHVYLGEFAAAYADVTAATTHPPKSLRALELKVFIGAWTHANPTFNADLTLTGMMPFKNSLSPLYLAHMLAYGNGLPQDIPRAWQILVKWAQPADSIGRLFLSRTIFDLSNGGSDAAGVEQNTSGSNISNSSSSNTNKINAKPSPIPVITDFKSWQSLSRFDPARSDAATLDARLQSPSPPPALLHALHLGTITRFFATHCPFMGSIDQWDTVLALFEIVVARNEMRFDARGPRREIV